MLGGLVVAAGGVRAGRGGGLAGAGGLSALSCVSVDIRCEWGSEKTYSLAGLVGVDLAVGELAGADALIRGTILLEAAVLCEGDG